MTWLDRLREAAYTAPDGTRLTFDYEDVGRQQDKKTAAFDFPDADGTYVQDNGTTGRQYPLRVIFWGADYDERAGAFFDALGQRGPGLLEHPAYGQHEVVPFGEIRQRDDLKTAANQAVIEVTFWATTGVIYPSEQTDPAAEVLAAVATADQSVAEEFESVSDLAGAVEQATLRSRFQNLLDGAKSRLQTLAETQENVARQFQRIADSIDASITTLIGDPLALAFQTTQLIQAPARAAAQFQARLEGYQNLAASIFGGDTGDSNGYLTASVYASAATTGSILSAVNNQFNTRGEALAAAESILGQFDDLVTWRDEQAALYGIVDTGASYQALQDAAALAAGFLVQISFSLAQERTIVLGEARTIVDLAAELYGSVDDRLDFLIATNDLTGSEILELPVGKEVLYYE